MSIAFAAINTLLNDLETHECKLCYFIFIGKSAFFIFLKTE